MSRAHRCPCAALLVGGLLVAAAAATAAAPTATAHRAGGRRAFGSPLAAFTPPRKFGNDNYLLEFHGVDCEQCEDMEPLMEKLEDELGVKVKRFEVWYDPENYKLLQSLDADGKCGGLPFYFNRKTMTAICGATTYRNFKAWGESRKHSTLEPPPPKEAEKKTKKRTGAFGRILKKLDDVKSKGQESMSDRMSG